MHVVVTSLSFPRRVQHRRTVNDDENVQRLGFLRDVKGRLPFNYLAFKYPSGGNKIVIVRPIRLGGSYGIIS